YDSKISALAGYYGYTEVNSDGSFFISNKGAIVGVNYTGQYRFGQNYTGTAYISPDVTLYGGTLKYHSLSSGDHDNATYFLAEARGLIGYDFAFTSLHHVNLFTGAGYRFTGNFDDGKVTDQNYAAYDRINHLGYIPVGAGYSYGNANSDFSFAIRGEYDIFLGGLQLTYYEPTAAIQYPNGLGTTALLSTTPFQNKQTTGYGFKTSLSLAYKQFVLQPFFNYWDIGVSSAVYYNLPCINDNGTTIDCKGGTAIDGKLLPVQFTEPANNTIEAGASIGYSF
ncbi:MAG: hypothetical protein QM529_03685, partial [Hydrotalea sp.]|nr:hypothetical protein [Hydrotalea sp.]